MKIADKFLNPKFMRRPNLPFRYQIAGRNAVHTFDIKSVDSLI